MSLIHSLYFSEDVHNLIIPAIVAAADNGDNGADEKKVLIDIGLTKCINCRNW